MKALVIGWREGSFAALKRLGIEIVCIGPADKADVAPSCGVTHYVPVPDVTDIENVLFHAKRLVDGGWGFDTVATGSEFPLVCAAVVGAALGVRSMSIDTARLLRDKAAQKNAVRRAGVPVARSWIFMRGEQLPKLDYPVVVKPPAGAGAENTVVVSSPDELARACVGDLTWLIESFVSGAEMQIDGVVRGGAVIMLTVSRYLSNLIHIHDGQITGAIVVPRDSETPLYVAAEDLVSRSLRALGHTDGVFHIEAFETADGLVFSECGGRVSGGGNDEAIRLHTGVDIHEQWARAAIGVPANLSTVISSNIFGDVQLPAPAGRIMQLPTERELHLQPGVENVRLHVSVGEEMPRATKSSVRAATVVVSGATEADVRERMARLNDWFSLQTVVSEPPHNCS